MNEDEKSRCKLPKIKQGRLKTLLFSLLIFVCGMIVGGGIVTGIFGHFIHYGKYPERITSHIIDKMEQKLDLSQDQVVRIKAIFEKRNQHLLKMRKEIAPRVRSEIMGANQEIQAVLTEEQRAKWDEWFQKLVKRWNNRVPALGLKSNRSPDGATGDSPGPDAQK